MIPDKKIVDLRKQSTFFPFFGVQGCAPVVQCHCGWGSRSGPERERESEISIANSENNGSKLCLSATSTI